MIQSESQDNDTKANKGARGFVPHGVDGLEWMCEFDSM